MVSLELLVSTKTLKKITVSSEWLVCGNGFRDIQWSLKSITQCPLQHLNHITQLISGWVHVVPDQHIKALATYLHLMLFMHCHNPLARLLCLPREHRSPLPHERFSCSYLGSFIFSHYKLLSLSPWSEWHWYLSRSPHINGEENGKPDLPRRQILLAEFICQIYSVLTAFVSVRRFN